MDPMWSMKLRTAGGHSGVCVIVVLAIVWIGLCVMSILCQCILDSTCVLFG